MEKAAADRLKCVVKQAWGMSELSPLGTLNPDDDVRSGSSGVPAASMLYKIVDTETGELLPRGEEGEVKRHTTTHFIYQITIQHPPPSLPM